MKENWKDIKGYEGRYQISNLGNIKSLYDNKYDINIKKVMKIDRVKLLKKTLSKRGYEKVKLYNTNDKKSWQVHRLVAQTFIPNLENKEQVNHIDGNKANNVVENLEWCSNGENFKHAIENKLAKSRKVKLVNKENKYCFDNIHEAYRFINKSVSGSYNEFMNTNKPHLGYYWFDV